MEVPLSGCETWRLSQEQHLHLTVVSGGYELAYGPLALAVRFAERQNLQHEVELSLL
jgi:hypothetical protein